MTPERGGPVEHHLEVTRTARYWTLGEPDATDVWVVIHGYKQLARRFLRRFEPIQAPGRLVVAPEALSRFYASAEPGRHGPASVVGASWMTREDRSAEIRDYVAYLDRLAEAVVPKGARLTVLGFSQGTATAARWATLGSVTLARLVLWAGYVPHDWDLARAAAVFSKAELVLVRGEEDPGLTEELAAAERRSLEAGRIPHRVVSYAGGHDIDSVTLGDLASG